jgi:hypothetical protein
MDSPTPMLASTGRTGNGSTMVPKTDTLTPPKGIVNSSQLEMELMRMFANAVMFSPLPPSERGLPPDLKMQKDRLPRAAVSRSKKMEKAAAAAVGDDDADSNEDAQDEGGNIIHDTREMFASVEQSVARWRSVEHGYMGGSIDDFVPRNSIGLLGPGGSMSLRGGSVSVSVTMSDAVAEESAQEDVAGSTASGAASGHGTATAMSLSAGPSSRKRRRLE